jgi:hypothetical protein
MASTRAQVPCSRLLIVLGALSAAPLLAGFTPFAAITNVCPQCPQLGKRDVVTFTSGAKVPCTVVAQNSDYYVLARNGELRAALKTEVSSITWRGEGGAASLGTGDQILLQNGVVLHGAIVEEQAGRLIVIQVGTLKHVVWHSQVKSVHKAGKPHTLEAPAADSK